MPVCNTKSVGSYQLTDLYLVTMQDTFLPVVSSEVITPLKQVRLCDGDQLDSSGMYKLLYMVTAVSTGV